MGSPLSQVTAQALLDSGMMSPDTFAAHQAAGFTAAPGTSPPPAPGGQSDFSELYNKRRTQIMAPSPFDRPDAPPIAPDVVDQAAASAANGVLTKRADDAMAEYNSKLKARDFLSRQGVPASALPDIGAPPSIAKPGMSVASTNDLTQDSVPINGEMRKDSIGMDPKRLTGAPGAQPQGQGGGMEQLGGAYGLAMQGIDDQLSGAQQAAGAQAHGLKERAAELQKLSNVQQADADRERDTQEKASADTHRQFQQLEQMSDDLRNQKIDPNQVWHNAGTGTKITAALSIMLGGVGAAMSGQGGNVALDQINKIIDRDIDAQKQAIQNKKDAYSAKSTLFSENLRVLGDERAARLASRAQAYQAAATKVDALAAGSQSNVVAAQGKMMSGQLKQQAAQTMMQLNTMMYQQNLLRGAGTESGSGMNPQQALQRIMFHPDEKTKEAALKELPEYQKAELQKQTIAEDLRTMYDHKMDYTPNGIQRFKQAKTRLLSNTSELFNGKSDNEFKIMDGWVPGAAMDDATYNQLMRTAMGKHDSQHQFPVLQGMGIARPQIKMESPK